MTRVKLNRLYAVPKKRMSIIECGICLDLLNIPIETLCRHSFCKTCIQQLIQHNCMECPKCRQEFTRKRSFDCSEDNNSVMIGDYIFTYNLKAMAIINGLYIKCDFEDNGCKEVIPLPSLCDHIKICQFRLCEVCGFSLGTVVSNHNCLRLMKIDRDKWRLRGEWFTRHLQQVNFTSKRDLNHYEDLLAMVWNWSQPDNLVLCEQILFGTHLMTRLFVGITPDGICFEPKTNYFDVRYESMVELMYCSDPTLSLIVIKTSQEICERLRQKIQLKNKLFGWFDVNAQDFGQNYIIINLKAQNLSVHYWLTLKHYAYVNNKVLKCERIDTLKAKIHLMNATKIVNFSFSGQVKNMALVKTDKVVTIDD